MKTKLAIASALLAAASVHAATITQWTFETSIPNSTGATISSLSAEVGTGTASGSHASAATVWSNPTGNGSAESFSSNNWATGDYYQFNTSTIGFESISVSWDQTRSSTGPADFKLAYSTNGTDFVDAVGATWTVVASSNTNIQFADSTTGSGWQSSKVAVNTSYSFNLSAVDTLDNATTVYFRLIQTSATGAAAGTNRVDNFTVSGTAIPEPSSFAALAGIATLGMAALRRRRA